MGRMGTRLHPVSMSSKPSGGTDPGKNYKRKRRSSERSQEPEAETDWGRKKRSRSDSPIFLVFGGLLVAAVIAAVLFFLNREDSKPTEVAKTEGFVPPELRQPSPDAEKTDSGLDPDLPVTWFQENAGALPVKAQALVAEILEAPNAEALAPLLVRPEEALPLMESWPDIRVPRPDLDRGNEWEFDIIDQEDFAFLTITGSREDFSKFTWFFVRDGEDLKLDWEASAAYSEVSISSHVETPITEPVVVRGRISRPHIYGGPYDEETWSSFQIWDPKGGESMWAYTKKGSPEEKTIFEWMDYGRFIVELKQEIRGTFKVKPALPGAHPKAVELVEVVRKDWPTP